MCRSTADAPENVSNGGRVVLGKNNLLTSSMPTERLIAGLLTYFSDVLVDNFVLKDADGSITVTVPEVEAGDDYFIVRKYPFSIVYAQVAEPNTL